jgi:hypothetical protein
VGALVSSLSKFYPSTLATVKRLDRVLRHHDSTVRLLEASSSALEREAFALITVRILKLQGELEAVQANRNALLEALARLGVDLEQSDATVGRALRRVLGVPRVHRKKPANTP